MSPHLLILTQHFSPETGATAQLVSDIVYFFSNNAKFQTNVFTAARQPKKQLHIIVAPQCYLKKNSLLGKLLNGSIFCVSSTYYILKNRKQYSAILVVSNPPFIGIVGAFVKMLTGIPFIFLCQDLFPESAIKSGIIPDRGPFRLLLHYFSLLIFKASRYIIVLNPSMKRRIDNSYGTSHKSHIIHNWSVVETSSSDCCRGSRVLRSEWGLEENFVIQYSGNFGLMHDMLTILEAARSISNTSSRILFIGDGSKRHQLEAYARLSSNIIIKPYQSRHDLRSSLSACDISLISMSSGSEGVISPSKLYGILSVGKPILFVGRHNSYIANLIQKYNCGFIIEPGDPLALRDAIERLIVNPRLLEELSRNSLLAYQQAFGTEKSIPKYLDLVYESLGLNANSSD